MKPVKKTRIRLHFLNANDDKLLTTNLRNKEGILASCR